MSLQGANFCFISSSYIQGHQFHPDTKEDNNEFCLELLADVTLFSSLIARKMVLAIWGLCWYNLSKMSSGARTEPPVVRLYQTLQISESGSAVTLPVQKCVLWKGTSKLFPQKKKLKLIKGKGSGKFSKKKNDFRRCVCQQAPKYRSSLGSKNCRKFSRRILRS